MSTPSYEHLSRPIDLGTVRLKNRMMKNGTGYFWDDQAAGSPLDDRFVEHCEALARGGVALISAATGPLTRDTDAKMPGYRITSDDALPGWRKWVDAVHRHDCLAFQQLFHLGPMTPLFVTAPAGVSASAIPRERSPRPGFTVPHEITVAQIEDAVDLFAEAAERSKACGADGTELNAACNHLLNNFLSRAWNEREDEYGTQTLQNRTRAVVAVIREIKRRNGSGWPVIVLYNSQEVGLARGTTVAEAQEFARAFVAAGADALEVRSEFYTFVDDVERRQSLHFPDVYPYPHHEGPVPPYVDLDHGGAGANLPQAAAVKEVVDVPVITVGRMDVDLAEAAIAAGRLDVVSLNRRLLADPDLPRKVLAGHPEQVRPCTACMTCFDAVEHFQPVRCRVNPSLGHEREHAPRRARTPRRVVVVGAGPAGLEAARTAAERGHRVTVLERRPRTGGSLPVAALVKGEREDLDAYAAWLELSARAAGVEIRTGVDATPERVRELAPQVLVLATGGRHQVPEIPGIHGHGVMTGPALHARAKAALRVTGPRTLRKLAALPVARNLVSGRRVVVIGGRLHGCQVAEFLVELGKEVTVVDEGGPEVLGEGMLDVFMRPYLMYWLQDHGVRFVTGARYREVTREGLRIDVAGREELLPADTVITALPLLPDPELAEAFAGAADEVVTVGDAGEPGLIVDAVAAGGALGRRI